MIGMDMFHLNQFIITISGFWAVSKTMLGCHYLLKCLSEVMRSLRKKKDCFNRRRGCVLARAYKCVCAWRSYFQKVTSLCLAQAWISGQNSSAAITCIYGFLFTTVSFQQATVILYNYLYNLIIYVCAYLYAKPHTCWYLFNAPIFCIC